MIVAAARCTLLSSLLFGIAALPLAAQTGNEVSDLSVSSVRKALADEHAAIAAHPHDVRNYIGLAYTLTDAGMGEQARAAAANAVRVAPSGTVSFSAQGWVLQHNAIGVEFGSGFDYDGALRAYRRSIELDPENLDVRQNLANLLEFNREGVRYAADAQLALAIEAYRYIESHENPVEASVVDNLAIDLFYAGRYDEAVTEVHDLPGTTEHLGIILAATAALKGSAAAVALSNNIEGDEQRRKDALNFAAEGLWNKRLYPQAADLLTASLPDTARGTAISARIQLFRNLKPYTSPTLPPSDPCYPVQRLMAAAFAGTLDEKTIQALESRHSFPTDAAWTRSGRAYNAISAILLTLMKRTGLPRPVVADIVLGRMSVTAAPGSSLGRAVRMQTVGVSSLQVFVVKEEGTWKIAATGQSPAEVGEQALYLLQHGDRDTASALLTWYSSLAETAQDATDPLSGSLFLRLWAPSARSSQEAAALAAAALAQDAAQLRPLLLMIQAAREGAPEARQDDLNLLLATVSLRLADPQGALAVVSPLLTRYPSSLTALHLAGQAYARQDDWPAWKALLAQRLRTEPDSRHLLLESAAEAEAEGDYARASQTYGHILEGSRVLPEDYTQFAWLSLVQSRPDDRAFAAAQQAALTAEKRNYAALLTLACLHAARGNTAEAHQELLEAMSSANEQEPDAGIWYGFGLIFEQYGVVEAATSAYRRSIDSDTQLQDTVPHTLSASTLAMMRLHTLGAN